VILYVFCSQMTLSDVAGPSGLRMSRRPAALPPETASSSSSNNDPLTDLSDFCLQPDPAMTEEEARFFQEEQDAVSPAIIITHIAFSATLDLFSTFVRAPGGRALTNGCIIACGQLRGGAPRSWVDIKGRAHLHLASVAADPPWEQDLRVCSEWAFLWFV
jgi:hypothetical protein